MKNGKILCQNRKAKHDYFFEETYEAGIALTGSEVKSVRQGKCSIKESYVDVSNGEMTIRNMHISPYEHSQDRNLDPDRNRKLLMHKREIIKLGTKVAQKGLTLIASKVYLKGNYVKVQVVLAKGKKNYDKRESIKKKDQKRDAQKNFKIRNLRL